MELVEAVRDGSGKDFEYWDCMKDEYVSVLKLINENKL
jgi:hypothetical protein